ncbi:hypothetical protein JW824_05135 [bacterium]|nr:hypothetical protein [bacterium]RQV96720.1 MAG: hypothetical protein EH221_04585 [bacterium]
MRFHCKGVGSDLKSQHRTFSLLPVELVPYRKLSLMFMVLSVLIRVKGKLSLLRSLDVIAEELCSLSGDIGFVHESALMDHELILAIAAQRFWKSAVLFSTAPDFPDNQSLYGFLEYCESYCSVRNKSIRGPPGLSWDYYILNKAHGRFGSSLFGAPSQDRDR